MARTKHKKLNEVGSLENVFSYRAEATETELRTYFSNANPISLEIGCGEGDYTIELAKEFPDRNFVGVDFKGARIYLGAKKAFEEKITNAAFLWINAKYLPDFYRSEKIEEIFITFPEPQVKRRSKNKRLVGPNFLEVYKNILIPNGKVHLKTDDDFLYKYAIRFLEKENVNIQFSSDNLYKESKLDTIKSIKTKYERYYLKDGRTIKYINFTLD